MNYQQYDDDDDDSVRAMDDNEQAVAAADFLMDFEPDESLQEAILNGLRALEGCIAFMVEDIPELSSPLAFNAWLMDLEPEEEEQQDGQRSPSPPPPVLPESPPPSPFEDDLAESPPPTPYELRRPLAPQPPPDLMMLTPPASPPSYMLFEPIEQRYYEVPEDFIELRDGPRSLPSKDCDADDEMEVSFEIPSRPRKRRRRPEGGSSSPPRSRIIIAAS